MNGATICNNCIGAKICFLIGGVNAEAVLPLGLVYESEKSTNTGSETCSVMNMCILL